MSGNREVWFGFYSSIRLGAWKPLVNIDMSATAFYVPSPLLDFATGVLRKRSRADLKAGLNDRERVLLSREIRTLRVTVSCEQSDRSLVRLLAEAATNVRNGIGENCSRDGRRTCDVNSRQTFSPNFSGQSPGLEAPVPDRRLAAEAGESGRVRIERKDGHGCAILPRQASVP